MGCCELHSPTSYVLTTQEKVLYQSILLKTKKPSVPKKTVRFEISYTNFTRLQISEETKSPWYESVSNTDTSSWTLYKSNENVNLKFISKENKLYTSLCVKLNAVTGHEEIVCLINNPKYRMIWDSELQKMELFFGDCNLDASVCILEKGVQRSRVFERKVRRFKGVYYVTYVPYERCASEEVMVTAIYSSDKVVVNWIEEVKEESEREMENKFVWGVRLLDEVIIHKNN